MIHFEDLWNEAESVGSEESLPFNIKVIIDKIKQELNKLEMFAAFPEQAAKIFGEINFDLCRISNKLNINSYTALKNAINEHKEELFDPSDNIDI